MNISSKNAKEVFNEIYASKNEIFQYSFRDLINNLVNYFTYNWGRNSSIPIKYSMNDKYLTSAVLINKFPSIVLSAVAELFQCKFELKFQLAKTIILNYAYVM